MTTPSDYDADRWFVENHHPFRSSCEASACVETSEADGFVSVRSSQRPNEVARFSRDEWDAFLAGLRATESAERGEVVGKTADSGMEQILTQTQHPDFPIVTIGGEEEGWAVLRDLTVALAGRLLPPVVQTREEAGHWSPNKSYVWACGDGGVDPNDHRYCELPFTHIRTITTLADDGSPYGGATLTGRWRNVDE